MSLVFMPKLVAAGVKDNPYQAIAARDLFKLRHPPARPVDPVQRRVFPEVRVTGLTDVCGRSEVLLELVEAGKQPRRAILQAGEALAGVRVVSVDVRAGWVRLQCEGEEQWLWLSTNQMSGGRNRAK